ncbi:hypothetical protein RDI58_007413 [Solanum bulbocastanum]|uniref:Uncharacterized protein n=1 Tax=Solanum bulbocastanum TaxID=147425 RepID=A0AAN8YIL1_SOLBU
MLVLNKKLQLKKFCPYEAVGDVVLAFKKSFSGLWHCWSKVPEHV